MAIVGWYYLHTNGDLIYKRELSETVADLRESDFVVMLWPVDSEDRASAWRILVEALACGAHKERVLHLAEYWECDDEDAKIYANQIGVKLSIDGEKWCATCNDFVDLQTSPAGFGNTALEALAELRKALGYKIHKEVKGD